MKAARNGHVDVTELLLKHKANINAADMLGYTALMFAMWRGHLDVAEILLQHKADINAVNYRGRSALALLTTMFDKHTIAELLLEHVTVEDQGQLPEILEPLPEILEPIKLMQHAAQLKNHRTGIEFLLKHGAEVNVADKYGDTALTEVARYGHSDVVELLLEHGAEVNAADKYGQTPLMEAAYKRGLGCCRVIARAWG